MIGKKPVKIKVEFDDGTSRECDFERFSPAMFSELVNSGLLLPLEGKNYLEKKYVMVEWDNGWKEVFSVPEDVTDFRKYYVIRRNEEVGRLFMERADGYPEMIVINRKPKNVKRVSLL